VLGAASGGVLALAPRFDAPPREGQDAEKDASRAAITSVRAALDAHDKDVGLGAGGPLVNATRDAVRSSRAPSVGHATIEVVTDASGVPSTVRVVDASSNMADWEEVAAQLETALKKQRLKVAPGAHGVAVRMRVESALKTASGHDAQEVAVSAFGIPIKKSSAEHPVHVDVALPITVNLDPTDALLDATNRAHRVVSVWVEEERRL
jgi:hypothetical protein